MEKDSSKNDGTKIDILELESHFVLVLGELAVRESLWKMLQLVKI